MKSIAVTGATGFIGGHVVRRFAARGDRVRAYGQRHGPQFEDLPLVTYEQWILPGDLVTPPQVDALVHCAGSVTDWGPEAQFMQVNLEGTKAALRAFALARRVVHLSTSSVYDPSMPKDHVREDAAYPVRYLNGYGRSKMLAELAVRAMRPDAVILRPHGVYGRGETKLLPRLLRARLGARQLAIGDGRNHLSMTHITNLVQAVELAVDGTAVGVFNVADRVEPTLDELLRHVLAAMDLPVRITYIPTALAWPLAGVIERLGSLAGWRSPRLTRYVVSQLAHEYTLDVTAATESLGYRPTVTFLEGVAEALGQGASLCERASV